MVEQELEIINDEPLEIRILKINEQVSVLNDTAKLLEILEEFGNITVNEDSNTDKPILTCRFENYTGPVEDVKKALQKTADYRFYGRED